MINDKCYGFTLLELLICIVIIGFFITIVAMNTGKFDEDVKIAVALKDMKVIQTAIVNGLYPDLGYIPCGIESADSPERKQLEGLFVPAYLFLERGKLMDLLETGECVKEGYVDEWDKYVSKGWSGPYIEGGNTLLDATYFDKDNFPKTEDGNVYLSALQTPWADKCEQMAREAEQEGKPDKAKEYRKGKYYQILYPQVTLTGPKYKYNNKGGREFDGWKAPSCEISRNCVYIVCRGADCLPPKEPRVDIATYLKCEAEIKEKALEKCCQQRYRTVYDLKACVKEKYEAAYPGCYEDNDPVPLEKRLSIMDQRKEYYMDIDDDLVMSVFGSIVRSPME